MDKPGLKAQSRWRKNPGKGNITRDLDGAYRVHGRKDGMTPKEALSVREDTQDRLLDSVGV